MTATTINATINGLNVGAAAKRIDIWHEGGGIGKWELKLDNTGGASELIAINHPATVLGINGVTLMAGKVDNMKPENANESTVSDPALSVTGRNMGRPLADLFIVKNYTAIKLDDLIQDALTEADADITYTSPSSLPEVDAEFNKTYLQNGFVEACQTTTDPITHTSYDFLVGNDKAFAIWPLSSAPDSGVTLKSVADASDNNILKIEPNSTLGEDIRNYIRVDGGPLKDHYTEGSADAWTGENCVITDEYGLYVFGGASLKVTRTNPLASCTAYLQFPVFNQESIDLTAGKTPASFWLYFIHVNPLLEYAVFIYLVDDAGNEIKYRTKVNCSSGNWQEIKFDMGLGTEIKTWDIWNNGWIYQTGSSSFNWNIKRFGVTSTEIGTFWIDGLEIAGLSTWAYATDASSITAYGKRMIPINRSDVKNQKVLQAIADMELANRKDPAYKLTLTCSLQTGLLYAGYLVNVLAPSDHIGSGVTPVVYRILSVHHTAEPGVDLCAGWDAITTLELIRHDDGVGADATRFKLASSPQAAINQRYSSRLNALEKSLTGGGAAAVGKGGTNGLTKDPYGYTDVAGIHFGSDWGDIYRQSVGDDKVLELSGTGLIVDGYINVKNISFSDANGVIDFGSGYPIIGRNIVGGNSLLEIIMPNGTQAADMIITGNLNVGRIDGGLSVNGVIGLSGDLSGNCFIQFGTSGSTSTGLITGAVRIAKTAADVLSIQSYNTTWNLASLRVSNIICDHIGANTTPDIYILSDLHLWSSIEGRRKLYDSTATTEQSGDPGDILTIDQYGYPLWLPPAAATQYISSVNTTYFAVNTGQLTLNDLSANKITSGTFDAARIPNIFNQGLNTGDGVTFDHLAVSTYMSVGTTLAVTGAITGSNNIQCSGLLNTQHTFYTPASYADWIYYMQHDLEVDAPWPNASADLRFNDPNNASAYTDLMGGYWSTANGFPATSPFLLTRHHLAVKKDLFCKGQLVSMEGCLTMYGNYAGWITDAGGFNTINPIVWLARSGSGSNALEIRTADHGYGGIICGTLNIKNSACESVTSSRQLCQGGNLYTYTNTSGKLKMVMASISITGTGQSGYYTFEVVLVPPGSGWYIIGTAQNDYCSRTNYFSFIVPDGWSYQLKDTGNSGGVAIQSVHEQTL